MTLIDAITVLERLKGHHVLARDAVVGCVPSHFKVIDIFYDQPSGSRYGVGGEQVEQFWPIEKITRDPDCKTADAEVSTASSQDVLKALQDIEDR